jgi:hypothetical protein
MQLPGSQSHSEGRIVRTGGTRKSLGQEVTATVCGETPTLQVGSRRLTVCVVALNCATRRRDELSLTN